jgi:hypothetical protein
MDKLPEQRQSAFTQKFNPPANIGTFERGDPTPPDASPESWCSRAMEVFELILQLQKMNYAKSVEIHADIVTLLNILTEEEPDVGEIANKTQELVVEDLKKFYPVKKKDEDRFKDVPKV